MGKKNPNRFTIGFNKDKPSHQKAVEILNQTGDKAELIASAILCYMGDADKDMKPGMDILSIQPLIKGLIEQEVQKAVSGIGELKNNKSIRI